MRLQSALKYFIIHFYFQESNRVCSYQAQRFFRPWHTLQEESDGAEEVDTWKNAPCEVCGRRYPHEHVKAVYRDHHSTDDEGSDFD